MSIDRSLVALLTTGAIAATLPGCGGGSSSSAASRADKAQQAGLDFARCMRQHGINIADPKPGRDMGFTISGTKGDNVKFEHAQKACDHFLKAAMTAPKPADQRKILDAALKWSRCMRQNGVSVPDPQPGQNGAIKIGPGPQAKPDDAAFQRADAKCRTLLPGGGAGRATVHSHAGGGAGGSIHLAPGP